MKHHRALFVVVLGLFAMTGLAGSAGSATVRVFAAASLTESLKEIAVKYQARSTNKVVFNFGASSTLSRQIVEGAPADIFFSADERQMDVVTHLGIVDVSSRHDRLGNSLVVIVAKRKGAAISKPGDLTKPTVTRIALGDPAAVPAGIYAREYLESLGLWNDVKQKIVATENVRAALETVASGNADAGIVYKTDANQSKNVKVACAVPVADGPKIRYPMALLQNSQSGPAAKDFFQYLNSSAAAKIFKKYGFLAAN
jgi:molybdate transport system substrate-binding protein